MGFTVVNTKEKFSEPRMDKRNKQRLKDGYESYDEMTLNPISVKGKSDKEIKDMEDDMSSTREKRLGSSREKARAADFKRKDKSLDEIDDDELDSITNKMIFGSKNSK